MTAVGDGGAVVKLSLDDAIKARVERESKLVFAPFERLRAALDGFERAERAAFEWRVRSGVLTALGEMVEGEAVSASERGELSQGLLRSLVDVQVYVATVSSVEESSAVPAAVTSPAPMQSAPTPPTLTPPAPPAPQAPAALAADVGGVYASTPPRIEPPIEPEETSEAPSSSASRPKVTPEQYARGRALVTEITELSDLARVEGSKLNTPRTYHLLQAMAAEARLLLSETDPHSSMNERLSRAIPTMLWIKGTTKISKFVNGLSFGAQGDWAKLAISSRRVVASIDAGEDPPVDSQRTTIPSGSKPEIKPETKAEAKLKPKPETKPETKAQKAAMGSMGALFEWPKLPGLRSVLTSKPLLFVGGRVVQEKLDLCSRRFGVVAEWCEVEDAPRSVEAVAKRIRGGSIGAVMVLDGFVPHKTNDPIVDACKAASVPYAMIGRGGVGQIELGLNTLDQKVRA